jgi:hypothetical protein
MFGAANDIVLFPIACTALFTTLENNIPLTEIPMRASSADTKRAQISRKKTANLIIMILYYIIKL